jgi:hypothetical protein
LLLLLLARWRLLCRLLPLWNRRHPLLLLLLCKSTLSRSLALLLLLLLLSGPVLMA